MKAIFIVVNVRVLQILVDEDCHGASEWEDDENTDCPLQDPHLLCHFLFACHQLRYDLVCFDCTLILHPCERSKVLSHFDRKFHNHYNLLYTHCDLQHDRQKDESQVKVRTDAYVHNAHIDTEHDAQSCQRVEHSERPDSPLSLPVHELPDVVDQKAKQCEEK